MLSQNNCAFANIGGQQGADLREDLCPRVCPRLVQPYDHLASHSTSLTGRRDTACAHDEAVLGRIHGNHDLSQFREVRQVGAAARHGDISPVEAG